MQDPSTFSPVKPHFPEQEQLKCPRCESTNTKFCYYNNYNLSQPRHFCKNCRRYWTKGGALRNIPVGGGSRKNTKRSSNAKRPSSSSSTSSVSSPPMSSSSNGAPQKSDASGIYPAGADQDRKMLDFGGSFSSLLTSTGQFGSLLESLNPNGPARGVPLSALSETQNSNSDPVRTPAMEFQSNGNSENFLGIQTGDSSCWNGGNGWPDLAIYTRGSTFQ